MKKRVNVNKKNSVIASIIIPTLNEEKNIVKLLKLLNKQTIPRTNYEIILSDSS
ncbi:MAG: glycosyltransferase, partial [Candidatus ainarchaeum sp.]|nr:glycosyltransferase [Candidatus ainarchaeum sp.]